jgi:hypothetical protein
VPWAKCLQDMPGLGALQGNSSSSIVASGGAVDKVDGSSVCLAVLEPRFTLSSGLEVGCAATAVRLWLCVVNEGVQVPHT